MSPILDRLLDSLNAEFAGLIAMDGRHYLEVDLGKRAETMGLTDLSCWLARANAVIPLKRPFEGMKVRIDGRSFVNYDQFDSGVVVPGYIARHSGKRHAPYLPNESMILNFV
jgi:hypothetical protein